MAQVWDEDWEFIDEKHYNLTDGEDPFAVSGSERESVGSSDFSYSLIDVENLSADPESETNSIGSPDSDVDGDLDLPGFHNSHFRTTAYPCTPVNVDRFPENIKRREDMSIEDIIRENGLPFLPAKSLIRFRAVCKNWDRWIRNPFLAHKQTNCFQSFSGLFRQSTNNTTSFISLNPAACGIPFPELTFLPEYVNIRSTCNGLLCCQGQSEDNAYYICNPVTMEWKVLPQPNLYHGSEPAVVLAFDPSALNFEAEYELICAIPVVDSPVVYFEIYSSKTGSWRLSDEVWCEQDALVWNSGGFYMKGIAYWQTTSGKVLAFDLKNEHYGIMPLPSSGFLRGVLTEMHGELCYVEAYYKTGHLYVIDIYAVADMGLKESIGLHLEFLGDKYGPCQSLPCINTEILVILVGKKVIAYHARDQKVELLSSGGNCSQARYLPYVNSLVHVAFG